ncbi:MAG TPA: glycosyltransferase family 2 protein [Chitinophagaceae bacterium]
MSNFSIVIVCRNEVDNIGRTLQSLQGLTDDIVVFDNGSSDGTQDIVKKYSARLIEGDWEGFGKTKHKATMLARHDWILSLDADEAIDEELRKSLLGVHFDNDLTVYDISFKNFIGNKYLKYGEWGGDHHVRLFNRTRVNYNHAHVHETLVMPSNSVVKKLKGFVLHQTMRDIEEYSQKMVKYAMLNALKYHQQGKTASWFKIRLSPGFTFLNYYILKLGFLDGHAGYVCAKMTAWYTFMKYARLRELNDASAK